MFRFFLLCLLVVFELCCLPIVQAQTTSELRTWKSTKGHKIEASLSSVNDESVKLLRSDGKEIEVKISRLSAEDQKFLAELKAAELAQKEDPSSQSSEGQWPNVTEDDLIDLGESTDLAGGASMREPDWKNISQNSVSGTWEGVKISGFFILNTANPEEMLLGWTSARKFEGRKRVQFMNGILKFFEFKIAEFGVRDVSVEKFPTRKPIADRLSTEGSATSAQGKQLMLRCYIYFAEEAHFLVAVASDPDRLDLLCKSIGTYRESGKAPFGEEVADDQPEVLPGSNEFRYWTDATNEFHIDAVLTDKQDQQLTLVTRSGKVVKLALDQLCDEDRKFVNGQP